MIEIKEWLCAYQKAVNDAFASRVLFIGLQGSYGRGEAKEHSDIDVVLILDKITTDDLNTYKKITETLPHPQLLCGFVSGREELQGWCRHDLFQFYFDTTSIQGSLDTLISPPTMEDAKQAVHIGACNLYHACSHNYLHAMDVDTLASLYKSACFVLQAKHFCSNGQYIKGRAALEQAVTGHDLAILQLSNQPWLITSETFADTASRLLDWSSGLICRF